MSKFKSDGEGVSGSADQSFNQLIFRIENALKRQVENAGLAVYAISLDATHFRGGLCRWRIVLHLDDPSSSSGGVRHVEIDSGNDLPYEGTIRLGDWLRGLGASLGAKREAAINIQDLS